MVIRRKIGAAAEPLRQASVARTCHAGPPACAGRRFFAPVNAKAKMSFARARGIGWLRPLRETGGAQLLEFALALPFLLVIAIGVSDFGQAYNLKHILTNAAREAARVTVSNPMSDSSCADATPCSVEAAADAAEQYLTDAGLSTASCIAPKSPSSTGTLTWTWSCNSVTLTINRGAVVTGGPGGTVIPSAQVTLSYPYKFSFGDIIGLMIKGGTGPAGAQTLTTTVVMQILVPG